MDELTIDGKMYVSSKRAASLTGYAKDYVGQLCREGRVEARLVGRSWYVYEPSLMKHRFDDADAKPEEKKVEEEARISDKPSIEAAWGSSLYMSEEVQSLPPIEERPVAETPVVESQPAPLSDMQQAWQEWFAGRPAETASTELEAERVKAEEDLIDEPSILVNVKEIPQPEEELNRSYEEPVHLTRVVQELVAPVRTTVTDIRPIQEWHAAPNSHKAPTVRQEAASRRPRRR